VVRVAGSGPGSPATKIQAQNTRLKVGLTLDKAMLQDPLAKILERTRRCKRNNRGPSASYQKASG
jgi:hypothetical protein